MSRITLLFILLLTCACGQQGKVTQTKFVIGAALPTAEADPVSGSLFVTAFNPNTQEILRLKMDVSDRQVSIPNGLWYFSAIYWDNNDLELATTVRCGLAKEELIGEDVTLDLTMTEIGCASADINASKFYDGFALQELELNQCSNIGSPGSNCSSIPGPALSARITIPAIDLSKISNPTYNATNGIALSGCINLSSGTANLNTLIPGGSANVPFPFTIRTFAGAGCTGAVNVFNFTKGLLTPDSSNMRVVDVTAATPDFTRIMLLTDSSFTASVSTLDVPAESQYTIDVSPFISGGTPPYAFTISPAIGLMTSSGSFTPANTTTTYTVTVRDATSAEITFTMQSHQAVTHTRFFDFFLGNWNTFRTSNGVSMPSASTFDVEGVDSPRFWRTTTSDRYLLTERPSTNYIMHSSALNQGVWSQTATNPSLIADPINGGMVSSLQKASAASSYADQTISHPATGTHTASAYFKAGTSTYAVLTHTNGATCHGVHVDLSTGAASRVNMAGCNGAFTVGSFGATNVGNGWWRLWFKKSVTTGSSTIKVYPGWGSSPFSENTGAGVGNNLLVYNVQVEASTVLTSPIETTSGTATRAAEYHENTIDAASASLNSATVLLDYHPLEYLTQPNSLFTVCDGTVRALELSSNASGIPVVTVFNGGASVGTLNGAVAQSASSNRVVAGIGATTLRLAMRGQPVSSGSKGSSLDTPDSLKIGNDCNGSMNAVGVRRLGYWDVPFHELILQQMSNLNN